MQYVTRLEDPSVGYTQAALQYLMSLWSAGFRDFHLTPLGGGVQWATMPMWTRPLMQPRLMRPSSRDLAVIHHLPHAVVHDQARVGERVNLGMTVTETDVIPGWVVKGLNTLDGLVVFTDWHREVYSGCGVTVPIHVLPHAQGAYWWEMPSVGWTAGSEKPYVFYYVGAWNSRKNPEAVLRAYLRAFPTPSTDVALALKLSGDAGVPALVAAIVESEGSSVDRLNRDIWVFAERWNDTQLRWLHEIGDCYVSAHRGEGWGIGSFQAALLGRPVVYTDWSAPRAYLSPEAGDLPIPYALVDVGDLGGSVPYFRSVGAPLRWAEPAAEALVVALRRAYDRRPARLPGVVRRQRAQYAWEAVGRRFVEVLRAYDPSVPSGVGASDLRVVPSEDGEGAP